MTSRFQRQTFALHAQILLALLTLCLLLVPGLAFADDADGGPPPNARPIGKKVEITPFFGFFFEGEYSSEYDHGFSFSDTVIEEGEGYGLLAAFRVSKHFQVELLYSQQETDVRVRDTFRDDFGFPGTILVPVDVQYFHAGIAYSWSLGQIEPFVDITLGGTSFDTDAGDVDDSTEFSVGIGGGVKVFFGEHFGLRFQGRVLSTDAGDDDFYCDRFDSHRYCYRYDDSAIVQPEVSVGLIFAF